MERVQELYELRWGTLVNSPRWAGPDGFTVLDALPGRLLDSTLRIPFAWWGPHAVRPWARRAEFHSPGQCVQSLTSFGQLKGAFHRLADVQFSICFAAEARSYPFRELPINVDDHS